MTDDRTSLGLATLREMLTQVDLAIVTLERSSQLRGEPAEKVKTMLRRLRARLEEQLARHPDNRS